MPDYYRDTYEHWYSWFSYIIDSFVKVFLFVFNGGFGGECRWRGHLVDLLDPKPYEKVVDICSGTGTLSLMIAERLTGSGEVKGIEVSPAQLRAARKKRSPGSVSFIEDDAQHIPFADSYFDKAVICGALHEMPRQVRSNVLSESFRILRPGGRFVVTEHNRPAQKWKARLFDWLERLNPEYPTYKDLLASGLTAEIERAGFRILKTDTTVWGFFQTVLAERPVKCDTQEAVQSSKAIEVRKAKGDLNDDR
jgi:ubiquinone/menaquinone biosynthesis C-methylase UbiE